MADLMKAFSVFLLLVIGLSFIGTAIGAKVGYIHLSRKDKFLLGIGNFAGLALVASATVVGFEVV